MSLAKIISIAAGILLCGQAAEADPNIRDVRVLSYNINALPSLAKKGGTDQYEAIAQELRDRRANGTHPHIVLLQEVFNSKADVVVEQTGYPFVVHGPGRKDTAKRGKAHWSQQTRKQYSTFSNPQKFTGSGLVILSDFPILEAHHKAFDSDTCAGIDCLANKAIMLVRLDVPGMDVPLDVINSHFNSRGTAAAPRKWTLKAHKRQTDTLVWFLDKIDSGNPLILAGDFNTKHQARYSYFKEKVGFVDIGENCLALEGICRIDPATDIDMVLYNTNDKHFAASTNGYSLTPTYVARNFTGKVNGKPFSDHLGYEVHYRLTPSVNISR